MKFKKKKCLVIEKLVRYLKKEIKSHSLTPHSFPESFFWDLLELYLGMDIKENT
jgi:hypothetical protein